MAIRTNFPVPAADRKPRQPVASKAHFLEVFIAQMEELGVVFQRDGKIHKARADYWDLFRAVKATEVAMTAAAGKVSLAGVGRYEVKFGGRAEQKRPVFRFFQSSAVDTVFKDNPDLVSTTRELDPEKIKANVQKIFSVLMAVPETEPVEVKNADTTPPSDQV